MSAIEKAAAMLRHEAESMKACHTLDGDWRGDPAEADYHEMIAVADAAIAERDELRAKIERMEKQEPVGWLLDGDFYEVKQMSLYKDNEPLPGQTALYALPGAQPKPSMPIDSIGKLLTQAMDVAVANGANSVSMPDELVEVAAWLSGAQPAPSVPEDVMRDAERYRYLRARDDGTAGVGCWIEANGRVCDRGWLYGVQLDSAIDSFIEVLAAAPKPEGE